MKVLIIEDEKAMSDLIAIKFQVEGIEVVQALSLAAAREKITTAGPFNLILTDYLLPDGNSTDLIVQLKNYPQTSKIPVLIMTNYIEDINLDEVKKLGVVDVLAKYQTVPAQIVEKARQVMSGVK